MTTTGWTATLRCTGCGQERTVRVIIRDRREGAQEITRMRVACQRYRGPDADALHAYLKKGGANG